MNVTTEISITTPLLPEAASRDAMYYIYMVGEVLIAVIATLGNALLIYVIAKRPQLHSTTNCLTVSLAAADFLVGVIGIPCALIGFNGMPVDAYGCLMVNTIIVVFTQISIFGLLAIAIERFIAIKFPFVYNLHCTPKSACVVIIIYWIAAIFVGMVPMFGWNLVHSYKPVYCIFTEIIDMNYMVYFNFFVCVLTPLLAIFIIYCYIFDIVRKQSRQIASLQVVLVANAVDRRKSSTAMQRHLFQKELKAAKWFAIVIGFFAFCWLPIHIINTLGIYGYYYPFELLIFTILLSHLNSAVNPILYGYSNSRVKAAMKKTLGMKVSMSDLDSLGPTYADYPNNENRSRIAAKSCSVNPENVLLGKGPCTDNDAPAIVHDVPQHRSSINSTNKKSVRFDEEDSKKHTVVEAKSNTELNEVKEEIKAPPHVDSSHVNPGFEGDEKDSFKADDTE